MQGSQTVTLTETEHNGRRFYELNDGQFFADAETGLVFARDDQDCTNPLGGHDGSATFTPLTDTPSGAMAGLNLVGDVEAARLVRAAAFQERVEEDAASFSEEDMGSPRSEVGSPGVGSMQDG